MRLGIDDPMLRVLVWLIASLGLSVLLFIATEVL